MRVRYGVEQAGDGASPGLRLMSACKGSISFFLN